MAQKILGTKKKGQLFVISAPAGTGKSTLAQQLMEEFPNQIVESCSCTTRPPRSKEIAAKDYHFITVDEFEKKIVEEEFLEYAKVYGHYYGTTREEVLSLQELGKHVLLVIDTQGALQLMGKIQAVFIFISPPSLEELKHRLTNRKTETEEKILERLEWAHDEMELAKWYDYHLVNDDINVAYQILRAIIISEEYRVIPAN
jgi:guanylate kinase